MKMRKILMGAALLAALTGFAGSASAASVTLGFASASVNLRAGPAPNYPVVARIPVNAHVNIEGCVDGWRWCDVQWHGARGWMSGRYLQSMEDSRHVAVMETGQSLGIPVVVFDQNDYWGHHYHDRSFYHHWHHDDGDRDHDDDRDHDHDHDHWH